MTEANDSRRAGTFVSVIILLLSSGIGFPWDLQAQETGTVVSSRLNVRPGPGTDNPPIMTLNKGSTVEVIGQTDGWLKIRHRNRSGWVKNRKRYIRISKKAKTTGAGGSAEEIHRAKKRAAAIQEKIRSGQAEAVTVRRKELAVIDSLNQIDLALNRAGKRLSALETEFTVLERTMAETEAAMDAISLKLSENRAYASGRLVALYKLDQIGRIHFLASADSFHELFQRETTLKRVLAHDRKMLAELAMHKRDLDHLHQKQQAQIISKNTLENKLKKQMAVMKRERSRRRKILAEIRGKKSLQVAALATLKKAADDLNKKIRALSLRKIRPEPQREVPGKPQREVAGKLPREVPAKSFAELKGLLKMPVNGKIISRFGPYQNREFNIKNFRSGIEIRADRGEPIRAVSVGKVIYANWFKGYGNMLIIDHGAGYYTVYANIEELFKTSGDRVVEGEVVATVGDSGSEANPKLYFEIRRESKPVDPLKWVKRG